MQNFNCANESQAKFFAEHSQPTSAVVLKAIGCSLLMMYPRSVGSFEASHEEFLGRSHSTFDRSLSAITAIFTAILQLRPNVYKSDLSLRERREAIDDHGRPCHWRAVIARRTLSAAAKAVATVANAIERIAVDFMVSGKVRTLLMKL